MERDEASSLHLEQRGLAEELQDELKTLRSRLGGGKDLAIQEAIDLLETCKSSVLLSGLVAFLRLLLKKHFGSLEEAWKSQRHDSARSGLARYGFTNIMHQVGFDADTPGMGKAVSDILWKCLDPVNGEISWEAFAVVPAKNVFAEQAVQIERLFKPIHQHTVRTPARLEVPVRGSIVAGSRQALVDKPSAPVGAAKNPGGLGKKDQAKKFAPGARPSQRGAPHYVPSSLRELGIRQQDLAKLQGTAVRAMSPPQARAGGPPRVVRASPAGNGRLSPRPAGAMRGPSPVGERMYG